MLKFLVPLNGQSKSIKAARRVISAASDAAKNEEPPAKVPKLAANAEAKENSPAEVSANHDVEVMAAVSHVVTEVSKDAEAAATTSALDEVTSTKTMATTLSAEANISVIKTATVKIPTSGTFAELAAAALIEPSWNLKLSNEFSLPYMQRLFTRLDGDKKAGHIIYPPVHEIFNAFNLTPFEKVRVVIIGQDPYHNPNQAHGLSFSVVDGITPPPSLKNIYKELAKEYPGFEPPRSGSLVKWAEQGVFLLNATLTVIKNKANAHSEYGWQKFTDAVIRHINAELQGVVFLLWGNFAQKKAAFVDGKKHAVIKTAHPSPLSYRKFVDCKCFTKANEALEKFGREPIVWTRL